MISNLLFITADQFRADYLILANELGVATPNLNELMSRGLTFTNHYAVGAPCGPSRTSIHSGTYMSTHRSLFNGVPFRESVGGWPGILREELKDPVLVGFTHTALDSQADRGFEGVFPGFRVVLDDKIDNVAWANWIRQKSPNIKDVEAMIDQGVPEGVHPNSHAQYSGYPTELSDSAFTTSYASDYIQSTNAPWSMHVSYFRPHDPYVAARQFVEPFLNVTIDSKDIDSSFSVYTHPWFSAIQEIHKLADFDKKSLSFLKSCYLGSIVELDHHLGKLFATLKHSGQLDDTLIIFTSDHGEQLGDHGLLGKLGFFDESYHVPFIVVDPRVEADATRGSQCRLPTVHVDVAPTIVDYMCGLKPLFQGESLRCIIEGTQETGAWRDHAYWEYVMKRSDTEKISRIAVKRSESAKHVLFSDMPPITFDYERDGYSEQIDRSDDPVHEADREKFKRATANWLNS